MARSSSGPIEAALTDRTCGAGESGKRSRSAPATRSPIPEPVASMIVTLARSVDALVLDEIRMGTTVIIAKNTGPSRVPTRNHLERTRSRYSRLNTTPSLRMLALSTHSLLDASSADFLEEDLVQRRLHELEPLDRSPGLHDAPEELLRLGAG